MLIIGKLLKYKELNLTVLSSCLIIVSLILNVACSGGGGSDSNSTVNENNPTVESTTQEQSQTYTEVQNVQITESEESVVNISKKIRIDLNEFNKFDQIRSKTSDEVKSVEIIITTKDNAKRTIALKHVSGSIYEAEITDLPVNEELTFEVQAKSESGKVIVKAEKKVTFKEDIQKNSNSEPITFNYEAVVQIKDTPISQEDIAKVKEIEDGNEPQNSQQDGSVTQNEQPTDQNNSESNNIPSEPENGDIEVVDQTPVQENNNDTQNDSDLIQLGLLLKENNNYLTKNQKDKYKTEFLNSGDITLKSTDNQNDIGKIKLNSFGRKGEMTSLSNPVLVVGTSLVTYQYPNIEMWYKVSDQLIEQGFTLNEKPTSNGQPLEVIMNIEGDVSFKNNELLFSRVGKSSIAYNNLKVFDSQNNIIPSEMTFNETTNLLALVVNDTNAVYPLTIDPTIQASGHSINYSINDTDNNGKIETVVIGFPLNLITNSTNTAPWTVRYNSNAMTVTNAATNANIITLTLTEGSIDTSNKLFDISYNSTGDNISLTDNSNLDDVTNQTLSDNANPVMIGVTYGQSIAPTGSDLAGNTLNTASFLYSEPVFVSADGSGGSNITTATQSSASLGDMSTAATISGIASWTNANYVFNTNATDNFVELSNGNQLLVYLNADGNGSFNGGTAAPKNINNINPISNVNFIKDSAGLPVSTTTVNSSNDTDWDIGAPSVTTHYTLDTDNDGYADALDVTFSTNILDSSITASHFSFDENGDNAGSIAFNSGNTFVSGNTSSNDEHYHLTLIGGGTELNDSDKGYLNIVTGELRDIHGNRIATQVNAGTANDNADPVLQKLIFSQSQAPSGSGISGNIVNSAQFIYSEPIFAYVSGANLNSSAISTASMGSMTTAGNIVGLAAWTGGDMTQASATDNYVELTGGNVVTVYFNTQTGSYFNAGSTPPTNSSVTFTPERNTSSIKDANNNPVNNNANLSTTNTTTWDVKAPSISAYYTLDTDNDGYVDSVDITFSENILDSTFTAGSFTLSDNIDGTGSTNGSTATTTVSAKHPTAANNSDSNNEHYGLHIGYGLGNELVDSNLAYLNMNTLGLRDIYGNRMATETGNVNGFDKADPVLQSILFSQGVAPTESDLTGNVINTVKFVYSEPIYSYITGSTNLTMDTSAQTTATMGSMTTARTIAGVGSWAGGADDMSNAAVTDNYIELTNGNILTVYFNANKDGYFNNGTTAPTNGQVTITPTSDNTLIKDASSNPVNASTNISFSGNAWDVNPPGITIFYTLDRDADGKADGADLTFNDNILDSSVTFADFAFDENADNIGSLNFTGGSTTVSGNHDAYPNDSGSNNPYYQLTLTDGTEMEDSNKAYINVNATPTLRDIHGNRITAGTNLGISVDRSAPVLLSAIFSQETAPSNSELGGNILNTLTLNYSENVIVYMNGDNTNQLNTESISTTAVGNMTIAGNIHGLIAWTGGPSDNMTNNAVNDNYLTLSNNTLTVFFNSQNSGYFNSGSVSPGTGATVTPFRDTNYVVDSSALPVNPTTLLTTVNTAWDIGYPTILDTYTLDKDQDGYADAMDITFSENILDISITPSSFAIDENGDTSGNLNFDSGSSQVSNLHHTAPSNSVANNEYFQLTITSNTELNDSDVAYLNHNSLGARDIYGNRLQLAAAAGNVSDKAHPVLMSVTYSQSNAPASSDLSGNLVNSITFAYSEPVYAYNDGNSGGNYSLTGSASTASMGAMTTLHTIEGVGNWAASTGTNGDMLNNAATDNFLTLNSNVLSLYFNARTSGYYASGSSKPQTPNSFTVLSSNSHIRDGGNNGLGVTGTSSSEFSITTVTPWDVDKPTITGHKLNTTNTFVGSIYRSYDLPTFSLTFSENIHNGLDNTLYSLSGNAAYQNLSDSYLTFANNIVLGLNAAGNYELSIAQTSDRMKSGSMEMSFSPALRDERGNSIAAPISYTVQASSAWYDEAVSYISGTADDTLESFTGGIDGVLTNITTYTASTEQAINGDGMLITATGNFSANAMSYKNFPQETGSVAFWYKPSSSVSSTNTIFGDANASGNHFSLVYTGTGNNFKFEVHNYATANPTLTFPLELNKWHHFVISSSTTAVHLTVDGETLLQSTVDGNPTHQKVLFSEYGHLDEIHIYDRFLFNSGINTQNDSRGIYSRYTLLSYNFNSNYINDTTNDFDGIIYGGALPTLDRFYANSGNSYHFKSGMGIEPDGHGNHIFPHYDNGSYDFWVKPNNTADSSVYIIDKEDTSRSHFYIQSTGNVDEYHFSVYDSTLSSNVARHQFKLHDYTWNNVGVVWDRLETGNIHLFVNGSNVFSSNILTNNANMKLNGQLLTSTPNGYLDDVVLVDYMQTESYFTNNWLTYTKPYAHFSLDYTTAGNNFPWLSQNDASIYHTTPAYGLSANGSYNLMYFHGGVPEMDTPHYGQLTGNSIYLPEGTGLNVYSLEDDLFSYSDGTVSFWVRPQYPTIASNSLFFDDDRSGSDNQFFIKALDTGGNYLFGLWDKDATYSMNTMINPIMERWNHFAISWTSNSGSANTNSISMYMNGQAIISDNNIGNWRPTNQHVTSTPYGSMDEFYIKSHPWNSANVTEYYNRYLRSGANVSFSQSEIATETFLSGNLLAEFNTPNPTNYAVFSAIHRSTEGHQNIYQDITMNGGTPQLDDNNGGTATGADQGAQEFLGEESFWMPSLDYTRFPQNEGTLRFWIRPIPDTSANVAYIFDRNFDKINHKNYFYMQSITEEGHYEFGVVENGVEKDKLADFELHPNTDNYVTVTWSQTTNRIYFYVNATLQKEITMDTWRPSDQIVVSTPQGVLDMLFIEELARTSTEISNYFFSYVTPAGMIDMEAGTVGKLTDSTNNEKSGKSNGVIINTTPPGFPHHTNNTQVLDLTTNDTYLEVPGLIKDLFPQDEGVLRFWYYPLDNANTTTNVLDEEDKTRNHFYINSQGNIGHYNFVIQDATISSNVLGSYEFVLDPNDWNHLAINWSSDRGLINLLIDGEVQYSTPIGSWRPLKQVSRSTPNGYIDDFYISYEFESIHTIQDYYSSLVGHQQEGSLYGWGIGTSGQLGDSNNAVIGVPSINHNIIHATTVAGGFSHGGAILRNKKVVMWGDNSKGQLGNGNTISSNEPVKIPLLNGAYDIDCGSDFTVISLINGNVLTMGNNYRGQLGHTPSGNFTSTLGYVPFVSDITEVAAGNHHVLALDAGGNVYAWGSNEYGQCGQTASAVPVTVENKIYDGSTNKAIAISAGLNHSLILLDNNTVQAVGRNNYGQLGDGSTTDSSTLVSVNITGIVGVAAGESHSYFLKSDGSVYAIGRNNVSQLGNKTNTDSTSPIQVLTAFANLSSVTEIASGPNTGYALLDNGRVMSWGEGSNYQRGTGVVSNDTNAMSTINVTGIFSLAKSGLNHMQALINHTSYFGSLTTFDAYINFDNNSTTDAGMYNLNAEFYGSTANITGQNNKQQGMYFSSSENLTLPNMSSNIFPKTEGTVSFWYKPDSSTPNGVHLFDQFDSNRNNFFIRYVNSGNITLFLNDTNLGVEQPLAYFNPNINEWNHISFSYKLSTNTLNVVLNGNTVTTPSDPFVAYSNWTPNNQIVYSSPAGGLDNFTLRSYYQDATEQNLEYVSSGNASSAEFIKGWGQNSSGQLGDGTLVDKISPVTLNGLGRPTILSSGVYHSLYLFSDGSVKAKGKNDRGQLGDSSTTDRSSQVNVTDLTSGVTDISTGYFHSMALKSDGTVHSWGDNSYGQLGANVTFNYWEKPFQLNVTGATKIASGAYHSLILANGNVYSFGSNAKGQLGNQSVANSIIPIQVNNLPQIKDIACGVFHSVALSTTGEIYVWGDNSNGQIGDGTTINRNTPTKITSIVDTIENIYCGDYFNIASTVNHATIYGWGLNSSGQLAKAFPSTESTPITITTIGETVTKFALGRSHVLALTVSGTIKAWGANSLGQLGLGNTTNTFTPTTVPGVTGVINITVFQNTSIALGQ